MGFSFSDTISLVLGTFDTDTDSLPIAFEDIYSELCQIAQYAMRRERPNHTLQPTALVHEACLKLAGNKNYFEGDRLKILAAASRIMRQILIDYARSKNAKKRGGGMLRVSLGQANLARAQDPDIEDLEEQLSLLEQIEPRRARILELKFFGGLTIEEISGLHKVSPKTVRKEMTLAKNWLLTRLGNRR